MPKDELPSINDILGDSNLPSYKDFLEKKKELPSVEEYITESNQNNVEEETQTIENADGESFLEVADIVKAPEWTELVRLVNDVRKDIPQIPEIKSYDDELSNICEQITQIQTNFSLLDAKSDKITDLSAQNEEFEGKLTEIESKIPEISEIRYYDEDIRFIYDKISRIKEDINNLPEVKYYEEDLKSLQERIEEVNKTIPTFPDWVQEVQEVPDFSWIGKTFSLIDDDFNKVQGHLDVIREKIDYQVSELTESLEKKEFEINVDIKRLTEELTDTSVVFNEVKENLYKEIMDCSVRLWEHHKEFKDDDRKLKKAILSEQNKLKQSLQKEIKEINEQSVKADESILNFFVDLKETVDSLPQVKYYDEDVSRIDEDILSIRKELKELSQLAYLIKTEQTVLKENYLLNEPPSEKETAGNQTDPLTPLDQNFVTFDQLQNHYRLFINRIQQQLSTLGGGGETRLKYLDDIVGIATNPSVYDGKFLKYDHSSRKFEFSQPTAVATGVAEDGIIYVAKNGDDSNAGTLTEPKLTIKSAVDSIVSAGTTDKVVRVAPGTYIENNPIILPDEITVIGHSLRENTIIPLNDDKDLFYVGNGNYIAEMSFRGSMPGKAIVAYDPEKPRYINQSPYIQNCTNFIPDSIGLKIDGNAAIGPLKSMVLDSYTQYNQGGIGASITNQGYAQLVSMFTICNEEAIVCASGGACDLTNSNSSFGTKGLVADGVSGKKYAGIVTTAAAALSDKFEVDLSTSTLSVSTATYTASTGEITITTTTDHDFNVGMGVTISGLVMNCGGSNTDTFPSGKNGYVFNVTEVVSSTQFKTFVGVSTLNHYYESGGTVKTYIVRPYDGQVIFFNELYETVDKITITDGGSGYTSAPVVTISSPSESWGITAKAIATIENGAVTEIEMVSNGRGYETTPTVTIAAPSSGINTAIGIAVLEPEYYTVKESTEISSGISTVTINENVPFAVGVGTTVKFFKQSRVLATGHSFEFIGSGTEIANSIPFNGGNPPIPENEVINTQGGLVIHTSTNQSGNFKIGDGITINQNTSSITGQAYEKSLVSTITPYILSLGAL